MSDRTTAQLKDMITSRLEKRKALAKDTLELAVSITKNRTNRAELSTEIKGLVKELKVKVSADRKAAAAERKAASAKKPKAEVKTPVAA